MSARLRNGGCLTLFPAFPSPCLFPSDTLPALIELFASPPVIVAGAPNSLLLTASLAKGFFHSHATAAQRGAQVHYRQWKAAKRRGKKRLAPPCSFKL